MYSLLLLIKSKTAAKERRTTAMDKIKHLVSSIHLQTEYPSPINSINHPRPAGSFAS
jgi:hypothetical protein